ncbi:MAG: hypothetical protein IKE15_09130 [Clostridia bacterium]|nr:hypothetical protein [Clostridia bacterium]
METKQKFEISIDRVEKIPVPLLVVGLGGTGCDSLLTIKETFAERYILPKDAKGQELPAPIKTAYLGFDSRAERPEGLEVSEYVDISYAGLEKTLINQNELLYPHEKEWVNTKLKSTGISGNGMQANRQAARLALSRNYDKVNQAIKGAIQGIVSTTAGSSDARANHVEIVVVTGIGGGTGSGTFLDMCQILRAAAKETTVIPATMTGYIVMPDVSLMNVAAATGMEDPIKHNAYAALKELDFWMRVKEHEVPYRMVYGNNSATIEWKEPPLDHCILMSSSNVEGIPYKDGYQAVRGTIAENLMHYMAKEDGVKQEYSYRQYENNLGSISIQKSYPLYHGYRAIGAFTKRIPKKSILYYEGALLFQTFIPMRDDSGKLQPDRRMFTDGQGKVRAEEITGNGKQLLTDFRTNISKLPGFCNLDIKDKVKVASVQNLNPAPHNKWHTWRDTVCAPTALKASETYLNKAWERFENFARSVIMDPEQGPFALEAYLDAQNGLISYMDEILASWENQYRKTRNQAIAQSEEQCNASWPTFRNPPVLGRTGALEQYVHAVATLYTYVNNCEFLEKHVESLRKLILRVKEYLRDGLKPMCAAILSLEAEFNKQTQDDAVLVQDIYSLETVQDSIDEAFKEANAEQKMSSRFLEKVAEIAEQTQPNVDAKTSGVEFICRNVGLQTMCQAIEKELKTVYGDVNNQSLDQIMIANVGEDLAAQQRWMDNLATSALDSALPMFMQDAVFKSAQVAPYCYMSIPANAPEHLKYIQSAFATHDPAVQPKESSLDDHIYVLTAWDKLPLFRYGLFEELRKAYDNDLNRETALGIHLVRNGNSDADFRNDWSQLPSPKPYFLFAKSSVLSETMQYKKVHELVEKGIRCGMINVQDDEPYTKASVNLLYANSVALLSSEAMRQKAKEIEEAVNPATGDTYSKSEICSRLNDFLKSAKTVVLEQKEISPSNVASVLDLGNEPTNPFDPALQGDMEKLRLAKDNHKRLCVVMAEAMIYCRPDIVNALEMQLPAYEEISSFIGSGVVTEKTWEVRNAYAETAAELFMFLNDIIFQGGSGLKYKNKGQKYDIITESLLADDLKDCESDLVKTASFLADVPKDNGAKFDLERMLNTKRREFEDAIDGETLTKDEMDEILTAATELIDELKGDQENLEHEIHVNPARTDELKPQADMAGAMKKVLEVRVKNYKKIAKGLD